MFRGRPSWFRGPPWPRTAALHPAVHDRPFVDPVSRLQPPPMTPHSVKVGLLVIDALGIAGVCTGSAPSARPEVALMG